MTSTTRTERSPDQAPALPGESAEGDSPSTAAWPRSRRRADGSPGPVPPLLDAQWTEAAGGGPDADWERLDPRGWYPLFGKRALTVLLLALVLPFAIVLSVPIALINWAIFRDASRILYHQPRVGYHGRVFSIVKFRTMRETSHDAFDSWKEGHDGLRVTRFGRFLRNTHLDELPQLLNILRGEMDFIGPRPEMIEIYLWACEHVPRFRDRHAMLPGITGLAQVTQGYTGMDETAYTRKLTADLFYLRKHSLRLDLEIMARTVVWMLRGRGWRWRTRAGRTTDKVRGDTAA